MKHEAKFSVVLPAANYTSAQIETFEQTVSRYGLSVRLPLGTDANGNLVVSSGLSLREAQMLRRQVATCGFPADVTSDASQANQENLQPVSLDTLVVDLDKVPEMGNVDPVSEITSDAWASLEVPSLDIGLGGADVFDDNAEWNGDDWLSPDSTGERTLSLSAVDLLAVAQNSAKEAALGVKKASQPAASISPKQQPVPSPSKSSVAPVSSRQGESRSSASQNPKFNSASQNPKLNSSSQNLKSNSSSQNAKVSGSSEEQKENSSVSKETSSVSNDEVQADAVNRSTSVVGVTAAQLKLLQSVHQGDPNALADINLDVKSELESISDTKKTVPIPAPNNISDDKSGAKSATAGSDKAKSTAETEQPDKASESSGQTSESSKDSALTASELSGEISQKSSIFKVSKVALICVGVCLVLALIFAFISPVSFIEPLIKPLF